MISRHAIWSVQIIAILVTILIGTSSVRGDGSRSTVFRVDVFPEKCGSLKSISNNIDELVVVYGYPIYFGEPLRFDLVHSDMGSEETILLSSEEGSDVYLRMVTGNKLDPSFSDVHSRIMRSLKEGKGSDPTVFWDGNNYVCENLLTDRIVMVKSSKEGPGARVRVFLPVETGYAVMTVKGALADKIRVADRKSSVQ